MRSLLLFAPANDPSFAESIVPLLEEQGFRVDAFSKASECTEAVECCEYVACVVKLGKKGNLGVDVIAACRRRFGPSVVTAVHSATAARDDALRERLSGTPGVDLFAEHGGEAELAAQLAQAVT